MKLKQQTKCFPGVGEASLRKWFGQFNSNIKTTCFRICLGMQCNFRKGYKGLGIFDIDVIKFTTKVKVPQMGWNQIYNLKSLFDGIAENEYMYLVHSFMLNLR
jgi:glutamine amidotransferase